MRLDLGHCDSLGSFRVLARAASAIAEALSVLPGRCVSHWFPEETGQVQSVAYSAPENRAGHYACRRAGLQSGGCGQPFALQSPPAPGEDAAGTRPCSLPRSRASAPFTVEGWAGAGRLAGEGPQRRSAPFGALPHLLPSPQAEEATSAS